MDLYRGFRTADEVRAYLPELREKINSAAMVEPLKKRRQELIDLQKTFYNLEQKAYKSMGFGGLEEFQKEIDSINESGLKDLSARALNRWSIIANIKNASYTKEDFERALTAWVYKDALESTNTEEELEETMSQAAFDQLTEELYRQVKGIKKGELTAGQKGGLTSFRKHFTIKGKELAVAGGLRSLGNYRKSIAATIGLKRQPHKSVTFRIEADYEDFKNEKTTIGINAYPYFEGENRFTEEELSSNTKVWQYFKDEVAKLAPKYKRIIMETMEDMKPKAFIVHNENDVKGIFGELQLMVILNVIGWRKRTATFTGHMQNLLAGSAKVGIDVLLDEAGFQVKNYTGYYKDNDLQGINLHHNWTLSYFLDKIRELPTREIGDFYALSSFHTQKDKSFSDVSESFEAMDASLKRAYIGFIDRFLPFSETVKVEDFAGDTMRNLFWFIGGEKIVPTSKIIGAYLSRLKQIIRQAETDKGLSVKADYKGMNYKNFLSAQKQNPSLEMPTLDDIKKKTYIAMTINFHLPSLLRELK